MLTEKDKLLSNELGFNNLDEAQQELRISQFKETLRIRIGLRLEDELDDDQLKKVVDIMSQSGLQEAETWLEANVSNYSAIVNDEEEKLKQAIKNDTDLIKSIIEKF